MLKRKKNQEVSVTSGEQAIMNKETEGLSQSQIVLRRFLRHKAAMTSVFVIFFIVVSPSSLLWYGGQVDARPPQSVTAAAHYCAAFPYAPLG